MTALGRRLVAQVGVAAILVGSPTGAVAAAAPPDLSQVVLDTTLPGFVPTPQGKTNGPIDASNADVLGLSASGAIDQFTQGDIVGFIRVFVHVPSDGDSIVIEALRFKDSAKMKPFLTAGLSAVDGESFPVTGIPGALGRATSADTNGRSATAYLVVFTQGSIAFEATVVTESHALTSSDAVAVALRQRAKASSSSPSGGASVGLIAVVVLGALLAVGIVLVLLRARARPTLGRGSRP